MTRQNTLINLHCIIRKEPCDNKVACISSSGIWQPGNNNTGGNVLREEELQVRGVIEKVFPLGTRILTEADDASGTKAEAQGVSSGPVEPESDTGTQSGDIWSEPPTFAADLFAIGAYLIKTAGLMGYLDVEIGPQKKFKRQEIPHVALDDDERTACRGASDEWRKTGNVPALVEDLWHELRCADSDPVRPRTFRKMLKKKNHLYDVPKWWRAVFMMTIISDEACDGLGHFFFDDDGSITRIRDGKTEKIELNLVDNLAAQRDVLKRKTTKTELPDEPVRRPAKGVGNWARAASNQVATVFPKARVTQLGCSVRNLSRNLALTGPSGAVRCNWEQLFGNTPDRVMRDSLNIVMIPWPVKMSARNFKPDGAANFTLDQTWLHRSADFAARNGADSDPVDTDDQAEPIVDELIEIVRKAAEETSRIDAVVFPELALSWPVFKRLFDRLRKDESIGPNFKFMVAGSSGNCEGQSGNFVLTGLSESNLVEGVGPKIATNLYTIYSQAKHHRWRLDRGQLEMYALGAELCPTRNWWEKHEIGSRELNFFQLRNDTIFASLICEDLARNDPCHDIMRSIGPNLIFALLMDGPQLPSRWPARYAGSLADDPGSTVVTFTSYALVERANSQFSGETTNSVGLVRDCRGNTVMLKFHPNASAILLTLGSTPVTEFTIDNRHTTHASEWFYMSHRLIE